MSSPALSAARLVLARAKNSDEALLHPPNGWFNASVTHEIEQACGQVHNIHNIDLGSIWESSPASLQKNVVKQIVYAARDDFAAFLGRRLSWWLADAESGAVHFEVRPLALLVIEGMKVGCRRFPLHVMAAFLKSLANAWVTDWRIGAASSPCPYACGDADGSRTRRLLICPALQAAARPNMPGDNTQMATAWEGPRGPLP